MQQIKRLRFENNDLHVHTRSDTERHSKNEINGPIRSTDQIQRQRKRGRFRIKRNYSFHCSFGCLLTRFDAEEPRNGLFSDDTNILFSLYVMKTLWSNRIVLGSEEEKNYDISGKQYEISEGCRLNCLEHNQHARFICCVYDLLISRTAFPWNSPVNWVVITAHTDTDRSR